MSEFPPEDFAFALSHTRVLREPIRRIDTFGSTTFRFRLLAEPMDRVTPVTVRSGKIDAQKPRLITADHLKDFSLEGFGEQAERFREFLAHNGELVQMIQYGWNLRRSEVETSVVNAPMAEVEQRVLTEADDRDDPLMAVIAGIEEVWEASLVRFAINLVNDSSETNVFDLKRRGLL